MTSTDVVAEPDAARPYGPFGLLVSTVLILAGAALALVVVAIAVFAIAAVVYGMSDVRRLLAARDKTWDQPIELIGSLLVYAAVAGAILVAARIRGGRSWREIVALRRWTPFRGTRFVWLLLIAAIVYNIAASAAISAIYPASKDWIEVPTGPVWIATFAVLATVFAPIAEELLFRGWIYTSLRRSFGVVAGIIVSSVLFALAHWESTHLYALVVFPVGIVLCTVRQRSGSILASMTFHALYNGFAVVLALAGS